MSPDRSPRLVARLRLLHRPFARGVRGDAAQVHPAGAVLDKYQDVKSFHQHGVCVQEVHRDDPGGLRAEELPLARARAARRWIDARSMQDLPHGGRRHGDAEFCQFAVDAAVSPEWILLRQANDQAGYARGRRRAPGLRLLLVSYLLAASFRCRVRSVAGVTGKMPVQRLRGMSRASAANHTRSAGSYRNRPT